MRGFLCDKIFKSFYGRHLCKRGIKLTDIHSHILYDMDDGPESFGDSLKMCETAAEYGIDKIITTSHLTSPGMIDAFIKKRGSRLERLREEVSARRIGLELFHGAEVYVDDDIFYAKGLEKVTLNDSRYLLVEFDFKSLGANRLIRYIEEIFKMGLVPIVAHPERYRYLKSAYGIVNYLVDMDVLFQINAGSLASLGGREEFELAHQMALNNAASFIATDSHSHHGRSNDLLRMVRYFPPDIRRESLDYMLYDSPQAVLDDRPVPRIVRRRIVRKKRKGWA